MHLLMIAPEQFPLPGSGSVEICMMAIARQWAKKHRVTIVSRTVPGRAKTSRFGHVTIVRVPSGGGRRYMASVLSYMKGKRFDWIQVDNRPRYAAQVKRRVPNVPVSLFLHSLTFVPNTQAIARSLRKPDLIVANSLSVKRRLARRFPSVAGKLRSVYLGVDTKRFAPSAKIGTRRRPFTILFAGRVIPRKGVHVLMKAAKIVRKRMKHARLVIAGKAKRSYLAKLRRLQRRLRIPVRFVGMVPHRRIHVLYRKAQCFVCPSQRHEAFGLVNVEAMASGVPVIASRIGGIREIIVHGRNGFLVSDYDNAAQFAKYIVKLAARPKLAKRLSVNGRKTALAKFQWRVTAAKLEHLYGAL